MSIVRVHFHGGACIGLIDLPLKIRINNKMDFMDNNNIINDIHFSETTYKLVHVKGNRSNALGTSEDLYFKYSDSPFSVHEGSYKIYVKNEKFFGDKYVLLQLWEINGYDTNNNNNKLAELD
eukprot:75728_1